MDGCLTTTSLSILLRDVEKLCYNIKHGDLVVMVKDKI